MLAGLRASALSPAWQCWTAACVSCKVCLPPGAPRDWELGQRSQNCKSGLLWQASCSSQLSGCHALGRSCFHAGDMEAYRLGVQTPLHILRPSYQPPPQHAQRSTPSGYDLHVSQQEHSLPTSRPHPAYTSHFKVALSPVAQAQQPTPHAPNTSLEQSWQGCIMHNSHSCDKSKPVSPLHGSQRSAPVFEETRLSRQSASSLHAAADPTSQGHHQQVRGMHLLQACSHGMQRVTCIVKYLSTCMLLCAACFDSLPGQPRCCMLTCCMRGTS